MRSLSSGCFVLLNVLFVVPDNKGYYILKGFGDQMGADVDTIPDLDLPGLDLVKIAEGLGVTGETVEEADAVREALDRDLNNRRPYLLNVVVEPEVPKLPSW